MARIQPDALGPVPLPAGQVVTCGGVLVTLMKRPGDTITTGITAAAIMVVAELAPEHAWRQPILGLIDTAAGVAAAWIGNPVMHAGTVFEQGRFAARNAE